MGYILPVTNYQYIQYAEREVRTEYDPFHIGRISRIRKEDPVEKGQDYAIAKTQSSPADNYISMNRIYKNSVNPVLVSKTYAEITGKGKHYSESI
jgi:hypothetical protein